MYKVFAIALLSLMTELEYRLGFVLVRPFDLIIAGLAVHFLLRLFRGHHFDLPAGVIWLLPFFGWHTLMAFDVSMSNGVREFLQVGLLTVFALLSSQYMREMDLERLGKWILAGIIVITVFVIAWHVANGFYAGWKRLGQSKTVFTYLPLIFGVMSAVDHKRSRAFEISIWAILGIVILASGERKALLIYATIASVVFSRGRYGAVLLLAPSLLFVVLVIGEQIDNPYLQRQITTFWRLFEVEQSLPLMAYVDGYVPDSLSDVQRRFAFQFGTTLMEQSPWIGVGTNHYEDVIRVRYASLPEYLTVGIHNEFFRVAVENGYIGLALYALVWVAAFVRVLRVCRLLVLRYQDAGRKSYVIGFCILFPNLISCFFEASGTQAMVALIFASLTPEILLILFARQHAARTQQYHEQALANSPVREAFPT